MVNEKLLQANTFAFSFVNALLNPKMGKVEVTLNIECYLKKPQLGMAFNHVYIVMHLDLMDVPFPQIGITNNISCPYILILSDWG